MAVSPALLVEFRTLSAQRHAEHRARILPSAPHTNRRPIAQVRDEEAEGRGAGGVR